MKSKAVTLLFFVVILGGAGYAYRGKLEILKQQFLPTVPCASPITYSIGDFDNRFEISEEKFKQAVVDAEQIWEEPAGREFWNHQDNGKMPIALIYDSRQEATDKLRALNLSVDSTKDSYDQLKSTYLKYKAQYEQEQRQYLAKVRQFEARKKAYEKDVEQANSRGGATPEQYQKLNAQLAELNAMRDSLNREVENLNQLTENINALASTLNRIGTELNQDVSTYNATGKNLGEFEEGLYTTDGFNKKIDIYQFDSYDSLVRVLAHELGHSLGLEHVDDPDSIMYKLNQSKNSLPTKADIAELNRVCK